MTDQQVQQKLNRLTALCNELVNEAKRRYGPEGNLFYESEGSFHLMSGDADASNGQRQEFIKMSSKGYCRLGAGAW